MFFFLVMHNFIFGVLEETGYRTYLVERAYYLTTLIHFYNYVFRRIEVYAFLTP
jgi:hypothetical protein